MDNIIDISNTKDKDILNKLREFIIEGGKEGIFSCHFNLSLDDIIEYIYLNSLAFNYKIFIYIYDYSSVIGYIDYVTLLGRAHILGLYVDKLFRRKGIGSKLLKHIELHAINSNICWIETFINESNTISQLFFTNMGYIPVNIYNKFKSCRGIEVERLWVKYLC